MLSTTFPVKTKNASVRRRVSCIRKITNALHTLTHILQ